jgi:hypothetical protein
MAAGKNKIESGVRIWFDDTGGTARDLSSSLVPGSLSGPGFTAAEVSLRGVSESAEGYYADVKDNSVTAQFYLDDTATTGSHTVLSAQMADATKEGTLTIQIGDGGAAPIATNPEWEGEYVLTQYDTSISGGAVITSATWRPQAGQSAPAWGTMA